MGDTAVVSAQGVWTVSRREGEAPRATRFFVTDTWVNRGGQWQVIHRYSSSSSDSRMATSAARIETIPIIRSSAMSSRDASVMQWGPFAASLLLPCNALSGQSAFGGTANGRERLK